MTNAIILAIGAYWLLAGLRIIIDPKFADRVLEQFEANEAMTFFMGVILLLAGVIALQYHNQWSDWREGLASLILWAIAIEGAMMVILPKTLFNIARKMVPGVGAIRVLGIAITLLGGFLIWF